MLAKPDETAAWLVYSSLRAQFRDEQFSKVFPEEKSYRHSLAEEVTALEGVVLVYGGETGGQHGKRIPSLELLSKLKDEEMLEPFVLLTHADAGIAHDYPAYRDAHRDRLIGFMDRYLVPPAR